MAAGQYEEARFFLEMAVTCAKSLVSGLIVTF
jgi:hypothetical protein